MSSLCSLVFLCAKKYPLECEYSCGYFVLGELVDLGEGIAEVVDDDGDLAGGEVLLEWSVACGIEAVHEVGVGVTNEGHELVAC